MENKGIIQEINGNKITVKLYKDSSCSHCSGCSESSKFGKDFEFVVDQPAEVGDTVIFEIETKQVMKAVGIAYVMPPAVMILAYLFADKILGLSENMCITGSFAGLILAFIFLFFYDRMVVKKRKNSDINIIFIGQEDTSQMVDSCKDVGNFGF